MEDKTKASWKKLAGFIKKINQLIQHNDFPRASVQVNTTDTLSQYDDILHDALPIDLNFDFLQGVHQNIQPPVEQSTQSNKLLRRSTWRC